MAKKTGKAVSEKPENSTRVLLNAFNEASKITFSLVFFPIVLLLGGVWLDKRFDTIPFFILAGIISGVLIGIWQASRIKKVFTTKNK